VERLAIGVGEAARALSVGKLNMYRMVRAGRVPSVRLGKRILIPVKALHEMLEQAGKPKEEVGRK
jgi:excisionase family DNA binding protein